MDPALPRTESILPHLGPVDERTVARSFSALQHILRLFSTISAFSVPDADGGLEPPLDELVDAADDAVELGHVEVLEQHATDEIQVTVGSGREVRGVRMVVAFEQEAVQLELVRR